jgi:hypothetical protein
MLYHKAKRTRNTIGKSFVELSLFKKLISPINPIRKSFWELPPKWMLENSIESCVCPMLSFLEATRRTFFPTTTVF